MIYAIILSLIRKLLYQCLSNCQVLFMLFMIRRYLSLANGKCGRAGVHIIIIIVFSFACYMLHVAPRRYRPRAERNIVKLFNLIDLKWLGWAGNTYYLTSHCNGKHMSGRVSPIVHAVCTECFQGVNVMSIYYIHVYITVLTCMNAYIFYIIYLSIQINLLRS